MRDEKKRKMAEGHVAPHYTVFFPIRQYTNAGNPQQVALCVKLLHDAYRLLS